MSEFWLCFNCCIAEQPQPKRRRRIDRSMIGEPTNFVHTAHVGSGDLFSGMNSVYVSFLYLLSCVPSFALVTAFCAHERSDGSLFTLCDYSSEKLLFCSDDAIYQIGPTVPFSGMHTLASTSIMDIELFRIVFSFLLVLRQIKAPTLASLIPHKY
ncbi:CDC42 small effector protein 2 isoform X1 [Calonectris borealis]|uniref:CDC42 small effector protein 2 isoform X1 n=1 Tax=Calonectris borealis TaxID=1323832 RepID=UPI003F4B26B8